MTTNRLIGLVLLTFVLGPVLASGSQAETKPQTDYTKFGISAAFQSQQTDLLVPIWFGRYVVVIPSFYLNTASDVYTDYGFGLAFRGNLKTGKAIPYVGVRFGTLNFAPWNQDGQTDLIYGPLVGGEYFLDSHFSVGVEAQLNITKSAENSTRFGNPNRGTINTATAVMATFYF